MAPAAKPADVRLLQGIAFLLGALALDVLIQRGATPFFWTPFVLGVTYLAAALAGGRTGGHWPTACVLLGWGTVVAWAGETRPEDVDLAGAYLAGGGIGVLVAGVLARRGFTVDVIGLGASAVLAGSILAFSGRSDALVEARTYAIAVAAVGVVNLALAVRARSVPAA